MRFQGQVAISTGAASGMGLLFAQCFAAEGGNVLLCDVNDEVLQEKVKEINAKGVGRAVGVHCDVRDYAQVVAARDRAVSEFGRIDVMANFAGGTAVRMLKADTKGKDFCDVPIDVYEWGLDVNLKGAIYFAHAALQQMAKQMSGVIVFIGSITGEEGCGTNVAYSASKSALMNGVVKSIAQCGAKYNVRAVCVAPGPVLTRAAMANMKTLIGRAAEPQE
ncbi:MAG: SDR family oxidoreductase, partial [Clostridia bacterium]|nr:SDR family oxidoreductase [Clostridia bacterium]